MPLIYNCKLFDSREYALLCILSLHFWRYVTVCVGVCVKTATHRPGHRPSSCSRPGRGDDATRRHHRYHCRRRPPPCPRRPRRSPTLPLLPRCGNQAAALPPGTMMANEESQRQTSMVLVADCGSRLVGRRSLGGAYSTTRSCDTDSTKHDNYVASHICERNGVVAAQVTAAPPTQLAMIYPYPYPPIQAGASLVAHFGP